MKLPTGQENDILTLSKSNVFHNRTHRYPAKNLYSGTKKNENPAANRLSPRRNKKQKGFFQ